MSKLHSKGGSPDPKHSNANKEGQHANARKTSAEIAKEKEKEREEENNQNNILGGGGEGALSYEDAMFELEKEAVLELNANLEAIGREMVLIDPRKIEGTVEMEVEMKVRRRYLENRISFRGRREK
jgi:hypothetical protein